jgi:hypothetical protein
MKKEKPIIFSTPMVKAILDGKKTMTRRVVKPQPEYYTGEGKRELYKFKEGFYALNFYPSNSTVLEHSPYKVGDILWVRETTAIIAREGVSAMEEQQIYKADDPDFELPEGDKWTPSIYMKREAARIFLKVVSVRVEQLQVISKKDAIAEGSYLDRCECLPRKNDKTPFEKLFKQNECHIHGKEFKYLWNSINEKRGYSWESNPYVWVIEFTRIENGGEK